MTILETERLKLRELTLGDAAFMLRLMNDPSFIEGIADKGIRSLDDARAHIEKTALASYREHGFGMYVVERKRDGEALGLSGLVKREGLTDVDIGYAFLPEFCGQGYAYEATAAILTYARQRLGIPRVVAIVNPDNQTSIKLAEKLGLRFEQMVRLPGEEEDITLYA